jgi:hypothetical protein
VIIARLRSQTIHEPTSTWTAKITDTMPCNKRAVAMTARLKASRHTLEHAYRIAPRMPRSVHHTGPACLRSTSGQKKGKQRGQSAHPLPSAPSFSCDENECEKSRQAHVVDIRLAITRRKTNVAAKSPKVIRNSIRVDASATHTPASSPCHRYTLHRARGGIQCQCG